RSHRRSPARGGSGPADEAGPFLLDSAVRSRAPNGAAVADQPPGGALPDQSAALPQTSLSRTLVGKAEHYPMNPLSDTVSGHKPVRRPPDWFLFFTKFLKHGTAIASFVPSSSYLARGVVHGIDFASARTVVELGAGTGPITAEVLRLAPPACRVVVV